MGLASVKFTGLGSMGGELASEIRHWRNAPHVAARMFSAEAIGEAEHAAFIEKIRSDPNRQLYVFHIGGAPKGVLQYELDPRSSRVAMGYYLKDEGDMFSSYGVFAKFLFIERAFLVMGAHKVFGETLGSNAKVRALHERFGYALEGVLRQHVRARPGAAGAMGCAAGAGGAAGAGDAAGAAWGIGSAVGAGDVAGTAGASGAAGAIGGAAGADAAEGAGAFEDVCQYGLLRSEWLSGQSREDIGAAVRAFIAPYRLEDVFVD
ncbi:MAG: hypothetical protein LBL83_05865 [Clostridiales bacterium]|jgi:UDP-4-amino-4,6-dideoxy-N-acetyl-beta-L-altrosamine N-acetyltransferase|nr:hypothetical protein [Clostridiales bacterium]